MTNGDCELRLEDEMRDEVDEKGVQGNVDTVLPSSGPERGRGWPGLRGHPSASRNKERRQQWFPPSFCIVVGISLTSFPLEVGSSLLTFVVLEFRCFQVVLPDAPYSPRQVSHVF